jgi:hypothetical protein
VSAKVGLEKLRVIYRPRFYAIRDPRNQISRSSAVAGRLGIQLSN